MIARNKRSLNHAEVVRGDLLDCVAAYRWIGTKTVAALDIISEQWNMASRRVRTLAYADQSIHISMTERVRCSAMAANTLDHIADELEAYKLRCRAKAEAIRIREKQFTLPWGGECRGISGMSSRRSAA